MPETLKKRVLLVEDSPTQAARLTKVLTGEDLLVDHVASAEHAFQELELNRPDLIVLDNRLPGMTGSDFCREIRLNVNTRAIPVLMLTSETGDAAQVQGLASGADDYVVKSIDPDILRIRVRSLLRKSESEAAIPDVESRFSRARVLAIDDSPTFLRCIERELQSEHYQVETASTPEEGLRRLEAVRFDCVLVDFEMDGLDGAGVCRHIRQYQVEADPEIVLIVFSSHDDKGRMTAGFEAGADDYISKSSDFGVTKARIRALLRRKFLVEENRRIADDIRQKELDAIRERGEREAAEVRAVMADELAAANLELAAANAKLDRVNQELEQFAYAAAHDLKEPLRKLSIFSELLQERYRQNLDAQAQGYLAYCVDGAQRMSQLIDDLLLYAKTAGSDASKTTSASLDVIVEKVLKALQISVEESGAEVRYSALPSVWVDEVRFQQLLQNLVGNALKYRRREVRAEVTIQAAISEEELLLTVRDNGLGIAPQHLQRVFEPFKRFHGDSGSGTGIGLAICRRIVDGLGGRMWAESTPGEGSTFYCAIPGTAFRRADEPVIPASS